MTLRTSLALVALMTAAFAFVTTETLPIGLLPQISGSLGVTLPQAGFLIGAYAFTVALSAVPATALSARLTRRRLLVVLLGTLLVTNVAAAFAPTYGVLLIVRVCNAVAHGVFWSIVSACAVRLAPEQTRGLALAMVFGGVSLATVGGVPAATLIGQHFGWRVAFGAVAVLAIVVLCMIVPTISDESTGSGGTAAVRKLVKLGAFRSLLATTVLVVLGQFVAYTYIVPYVVHVDGFALAATAPLLLLFGVAGALGNVVAGAIANRTPSGASLAATSAIAVALLALCAPGETHMLAAAAVALWGLGSGGLAVGLQTRVLALAPRTPELASALFATAFNIGIGGGALLGGLVVAVFGLARVAPAGAGLATLAIVVQAVSVRHARRGSTLVNPGS